MTKSIPLAFEGSCRPIGNMAPITLVSRDPLIFKMSRSQCGARRIFQVIHKGTHHVTGSTSLDPFGPFHDSRCGTECGGDRKDKQTEQEKPMVGATRKSVPIDEMNQNKNNDAAHSRGNADPSQ